MIDSGDDNTLSYTLSPAKQSRYGNVAVALKINYNNYLNWQCIY